MSTFGYLLSINQMTASRKNLVYARFCINVEQSMDLPLVVKINFKFGVSEQVVEFENIPFACFY